MKKHDWNVSGNRLAMIIAAAAMAARPARSQESFPTDAWQDTPDPLASPYAEPGGRIVWYAGQYPRSLNYYLDNNVFAAQVFGSMYETLLGTDPLTADFVPNLARRWAISEDRRTFTFEIDPDARWSDGRPVQASDVRWTFQQVMEPDNLTGPHKVSLEVFDPPEVLDEHTVRFHAREVHWRNLNAAGGMEILPRHAFAPEDFNNVHFRFPVVSGPYRLGEMKENVEIEMVRRDDWWARNRASNRGVLNFETVVYRFFAERENAFDAFRKGSIDVFPIYTARIWANETRGERFDRNWVIKRRVQNYRPVGFQGFAMNMRRPPFDDVRVRRALAHALDRAKMNATLMYNAYFLHRSYFEDLYDLQHPCANHEYGFDKQKSKDLLKDAGWRANPETGILEKDGRPLSFTFLSRDATAEKFLIIFGNDLKSIGVDLRIERKDGSAWTRDMDAYDFDMTWAAWGGGLFKDPESLWHSREAARPAGNNIVGFQDTRVDELIERQKQIFDVRERNAICRQIDVILTERCPYILLWNINATRLLYWDKFGMPPQVLSKYGDERAVLSYWWFDPDTAAELEEAMAQGLTLPSRPVEVNFDKAFDR